MSETEAPEPEPDESSETAEGEAAVQVEQAESADSTIAEAEMESDESVEAEEPTEEMVEEVDTRDAEIAELKAQLAALKEAEEKRQAEQAAETEAKRQGLVEAMVEMQPGTKSEDFEGVDAAALQRVHDFMTAQTVKPPVPSKGVAPTKEKPISQAPPKVNDRIKQLFGELPNHEALKLLIETVLERKPRA